MSSMFGRKDNRKHSVRRLVFMAGLFAAAVILYIGRLLSLQIANNQYYIDRATPKNIKTEVIETCRGEIADRNGELLVVNRGTTSVRLNRSTMPRGGENEVLLNLIRFFDGENISVSDCLPVTETPPYSYVAPEDAAGRRQISTFLRAAEKTEDEITGTSLYTLLLNRYDVVDTLADKATDEEIRRVVGLRYTLEANDFSVQKPYTLLEDSSIGLQTRLSELSYSMPGVELAVVNSRYYTHDSLAAHILGRIGPIFPDEAEFYTEKGYALDELVGKYGAEMAFEQYLRGVNGTKSVEYDAQGKQIISETITSEAQTGKTVRLTIDSNMQADVEKALKQTVDRINNSNIYYGDPDRCSGAVVVENCKTGELYVVANYPTYDQNTYSETISEMQNDVLRPLLNRATSGIYPPGSTFKIATAAAALSEGVIDENTRVYDDGIYREYETYQPHCWVYDSTGVGHGWQNLVQAIQNSCNVYFCEIGKRLGVEKLNDYAGHLGLGEITGIETGEAQGVLAGPEYSASVGKPWNPGDLLQSAFGQSDNAFTPLQLAAFFSTVVNGGIRYKTHILKSVNDFYTGNILYEAVPEVLDSVPIRSDDLDLLKRGMKAVMEDGTAAEVFVDYPYPVGGKTGTAQRGNGSNNAVFVGFAPYDDPQIVVSVVIENGERSRMASSVAKSVFDYYFEHLDEFE